MQQNVNNIPCHPISALTPFMGSGRQYIKARVTEKSARRTWDKGEGNKGSLFSATLNDETAAIRATFFKEACEEWCDKLQLGRVYIFGGFQVKNANRKFSSVDNDYELSFDIKTLEIHPVNDAATNIPAQRFSFVPIQMLKNRPEGSRIDLLAVVKSVGTVTQVQRKTLREGQSPTMNRQNIVLADSTGAVEMTLWDQDIEKFNAQPNEVVALRNIKKGDYGGVSLSFTYDSQITRDLHTPDATALRSWYSSTGGEGIEMLTTRGGGGNNEERSTQQGRQWLSSIEDKKFGGNKEKPDILECAVYITRVKFDKFAYPTCTRQECGLKKLQEIGDNSSLFRCNTCGLELEQPNWRYIVQCEVTDGVSLQWVTMFDEQGKIFMGVTATELKRRYDANHAEEMKLLQARLNQPYLVKIRCKIEEYQDKNSSENKDRVKCDVVAIEPLLSGCVNQFFTEKVGSDGTIKQRATLAQETKFLVDFIRKVGASR